MKHTIPLKQNHEFRRLYSKGKSAVSPYFVVYCRKTEKAAQAAGPPSVGQTGAALGAAAGQHLAAVAGSHALAEAVLLLWATRY